MDSKGQKKAWTLCLNWSLHGNVLIQFPFCPATQDCVQYDTKNVSMKIYLKKNVTISNIKMPGIRCGPARQSQLCAWSKSSSHGPWGYFKVSWKHLYYLLNVFALLDILRCLWIYVCCNIVFSVCVLVVDARPDGITLGHFVSMQNTLKVLCFRFDTLNTSGIWNLSPRPTEIIVIAHE